MPPPSSSLLRLLVSWSSVDAVSSRCAGGTKAAPRRSPSLIIGHILTRTLASSSRASKAVAAALTRSKPRPIVMLPGGPPDDLPV